MKLSNNSVWKLLKIADTSPSLYNSLIICALIKFDLKISWVEAEANEGLAV